MRTIRDLDEVRELLKAHADLATIMGEYGVEIRTGSTAHSKALCPFHADTDPSMHINTVKQVWYCHGACKRGGDVFTFVQEIESLSYIESVFKLAEISRFDLGPYLRDPTPEEREQEELIGLNQAAWDALPLVTVNRWAEDRRLDHSVLREYGICYSESRPSIPGKAAKKKALGLLDDWRWDNVVVIPMRDAMGRIAGFRNRPLGKSKAGLKVVGPTEGHPIPLPPLLGLREARKAIRDEGYAVVVEGEVDWLQMVGYGWTNTLCMMGSNFGDEHLRYLEQNGISEVVLLPDGDKAGRQLSKKVAGSPRKTTVVLKIGELTDGDPDEILLRDPSIVERAVLGAKYAFEYLLDLVLAEHDLSTITGKMDALGDLQEYFASTAEHERVLAVGELAKRLGMDRESILDFFREGAADHQAQLQNVRGERIVLSAMLDDDEFAGTALLDLRADHFYLARHRRIFQTIQLLHTTYDVVTRGIVETKLRNRNEEQLARYVAQLKGDPDEADFMLRDVRDKAMRRIAQRHSRDAIAKLADPGTDAREVVHQLTTSIAEAVVGTSQILRASDVVVREQMAVMMERIRNPSAIVGFDMGLEWATLNLTLHGFRTKRLLILAAGSTVGKTAVAINWTRRLGVELEEPVLYMSFETDEDVMVTRMLAQMSGVETDKIVTGYMTGDEVQAVQDAAALLARSPIVFTRRGRTLQECRTIIRHDVLKRGTRNVIVDYLQLMRVEGFRDRRDLELGEISSALLEDTRDLDIRITALAQLTRVGAKAQDGQTMEDVGESYKLAQDTDEFLILRKKSKEEIEEDGPQLGDRYAFLDKNRSGRRGVGFSVMADEAVMRYYEAKGKERR